MLVRVLAHVCTCVCVWLLAVDSNTKLIFQERRVQESIGAFFFLALVNPFIEVLSFLCQFLIICLTLLWSTLTGLLYGLQLFFVYRLLVDVCFFFSLEEFIVAEHRVFE